MKQTSLSPVNYRSSARMGQGAVLLCALFWSTSGLFIKLIDWHPLIIAGLRSFVAALFMLAIRFLFPRRGKGKNRPFPFFAGGLAYALTMICFVIANKLTASANAILLEYSAPVWAALLGWFLIKERPHWEHWLALALVMGGLFLF
ncbi:MAG: DMT family transporter, partial [Treponema sp.]|nr:DMT family transporter [Treponema sp.]